MRNELRKVVGKPSNESSSEIIPVEEVSRLINEAHRSNMMRSDVLLKRHCERERESESYVLSE